jgi:TolB protein
MVSLRLGSSVRRLATAGLVAAGLLGPRPTAALAASGRAIERGPSGPRASRAPAIATGAEAVSTDTLSPVTVEPEPGESHFRNLRMLTFEGQNAEAYFSADDRQLIFQATPRGAGCDQIYVMDVDGRNRRRVSSGSGRTTCAYFFPDGSRILYSSTYLTGPECPPRPDYSQGYVWPLYDYDIFTADPDGSHIRRLTDSPGYDAEATISQDGSRIVFTSVRDGDLEIYTMDLDGGNVRRLTHEPGYDGGPFFSPDGKLIVYRAYHPQGPEELADYRKLLARGLVRPTVMELWVMNADGSNKRQITHNGGANFAPYFHPDGRRIIFASNMRDPKSRNFDLYLIGVDGSGLERVTTHPDFDGFPMFSRDGKELVFESNRHDAEPGETNVFIADWIEHPGRQP